MPSTSQGGSQLGAPPAILCYTMSNSEFPPGTLSLLQDRGRARGSPRIRLRSGRERAVTATSRLACQGLLSARHGRLLSYKRVPCSNMFRKRCFYFLL